MRSKLRPLASSALSGPRSTRFGVSEKEEPMWGLKSSGRLL